MCNTLASVSPRTWTICLHRYIQLGVVLYSSHISWFSTTFKETLLFLPWNTYLPPLDLSYPPLPVEDNISYFMNRGRQLRKIKFVRYDYGLGSVLYTKNVILCRLTTKRPLLLLENSVRAVVTGTVVKEQGKKRSLGTSCDHCGVKMRRKHW